MNKSELIKELSTKSSITLNDCSKFVDALTEVMTDVLSRGETIQLIGFGNFSVIETKERVGRNPSNGKSMTIPAGKRLKFSVGKNLKDAVQNSSNKTLKKVK